MSEYLTHVAVADDTVRLALLQPSLNAAVREAFTRYPDWARTGSMTEKNHLYVIPLLTTFRGRIADGTMDAGTYAHLAFTMGWIAHRSADLYVKAAHRVLNPERYYSKPDRLGEPLAAPRMYNDFDVYHYVYADGARGGVPPGLFSRHLRDAPGARALDVAAAEPVVQAAWQADMSMLNAAVVADAPLAARVDAMLANRQDLYVELAPYADSVEHDDPEQRQRYTVASRFYDPADALLVVAEAAREGRAAPAGLDAALGAAEAGGSEYAQILARTLRWYTAAGHVLDGTVTTDAFSDLLVIEGGWGGHDHETRAMGDLLHQTILDR